MKKIRKLLAGLMAVITVFSMSILNASAIQITVPGELGGSEYQEYIEENIGKQMTGAEEILKLLSSIKGEECLNVYCGSDTECNLKNYQSHSLYFEYGDSIKRTLQKGSILWNTLSANRTDKNSKENIEAFLENSNFKAQVKTYSITESAKNGKEYVNLELSYENDITFEDIRTTVVALNEEFGIGVAKVFEMSSDIYIKTEEPTTPSYTFGTVTISGDIDLNNEQGISDIVTLSKFNANPELYPITDSTALANADMNQDGKVDTLDANILVEMALGTYESAV